MKIFKKRIIPSPLTLQALFDYSVKNFADRPSISFVNESPITYAEFGKRVTQLSERLFAAGFRKGDKVAIISHNMPNWVIAYFSIVQAGLIAVPVLPDFSASEIESVMLHSGAKALFVSEKLLPKVLDDSHCGLDQLSSVSITRFPELKLTILLDNLKVIGKYTHFASTYVRSIVLEKDLAAIIYTSGTTGRSKGVMLTHKNIVWNAAQSYTFHPIDSTDIFLSFLPLSHTYENTIGMIYPLMFGAAIFYLDKAPSPAVLLPAMAQIRPTLMLSVPLIMEKIYKSQVQSKFMKNPFLRGIYKNPVFRIVIHRIAGKKLKESFGGRLKFFGIGGSKLDSRVERFLSEAKFPYAIGYGLTEPSPLVAGAGVGKTKLQSTGVAVQGVEIHLDEKNKKGVGEIWVKGPNVMQGYYKSPELSAEVLTEDGWFKTGDLGFLTSRGRLYIKGRKKTTIIGASGENIYPEDIESVINNQQFVLESLVVEEDGFLVAKVLFNLEELEKHIDNLKENYDNRKEKLQQWKAIFMKELNSRLNRVSQIRRVDVVEEPFEKTASMKIKRFLYTKMGKMKN